MSYYSSELLLSLTQPIYIFLMLMSFTLNLLGAGAFYVAETSTGTRNLEFLDALYFTITTTTGVGYGDIVAQTAFGKIIAMGLMLLGTAIFAAFTATLATTLLELEFNRQSETAEPPRGSE